MKLEELKEKKITVMGLGLHGGGIGTARFLSEAGAKVTVTDIKPKEELAPSLEKLKDIKGINYVFNQHRPEDFVKADMVIKNPAASWGNKYIKMAEEANVPVEMDSTLFFKLCKNPIIGVTGTKGKTTASSLIFEILKEAGKNPIKVGVSQTSVLDKLNELEKDSTIVFELSSWRLSGLGRYRLSPQIAVLVNIYPDHLNYYKSMEEYIRDKKFIFSNQKRDDFCVINADDEIISRLIPEIKSQRILFSKEKVEKSRAVYISSGAIYANDGIDEKKVLDVSDIKLRGAHNLGNIMAAIGATWAYGVDLAVAKKAVLEFKGVPHRLEFIRELDGVKFYNDTAATTPESAMSGLGSFSEPVVLICGGAEKNLSMEEFSKEAHKKAKEIVFLEGQATEKMVKFIKETDDQFNDSNLIIAKTMEEAVELAKQKSESGDVILLSPGASSFGMFLNEFDRGDKFREAVKRLK